MFDRLTHLVLYLFLMFLILAVNLVGLYFLTLILGDSIHEWSRGKQIILMIPVVSLYTYLAIRLSMRINKEFGLTETLIIIINAILLAGLIKSFFS